MLREQMFQRLILRVSIIELCRAIKLQRRRDRQTVVLAEIHPCLRVRQIQRRDQIQQVRRLIRQMQRFRPQSLLQERRTFPQPLVGMHAQRRILRRRLRNLLVHRLQRPLPQIPKEFHHALKVCHNLFPAKYRLRVPPKLHRRQPHAVRQAQRNVERLNVVIPGHRRLVSSQQRRRVVLLLQHHPRAVRIGQLAAADPLRFIDLRGKSAQIALATGDLRQWHPPPAPPNCSRSGRTSRTAP